MRDMDGFVSAQTLHAELDKAGQPVGLATVYRTLQTLVDEGVADVMRAAGAESVYRLCANLDHHHHVVCRQCGHTVEVTGPDVERWAQSVADEAGFTGVEHTLEITGLCAACSAPD
jgi:Fur family ferric uptake transcriptional regulator